MDIPERPICRRCGQGCDIWKAQRCTTKQASFICPRCNCKGVQLTRIFGCWPPKMFKSMHHDAQQTFWKDIQDTPGHLLEAAVVQQLTTIRKEWEEAKEGGEYLPLSVYAQRGFDISAIAARCTDTLEDPILGTVYRIRIRGVYSGTVESMVRQELQVAKTSKQGVASQGVASSTAASLQAGGEAKDSKAVLREAAKQVRATKALAKRVVARVGPLMVTLEAALKRTDVLKHVPAYAVEPARTTLETLRGYYDSARDAHVNENPRPLHYSGQEVEEAAKTASGIYQLLAQMMSTAEKHTSK